MRRSYDEREFYLEDWIATPLIAAREDGRMCALLFEESRQ